MKGRLKSDQGQLFYEFHLGEAVPEDHLVRKIDTALDLSWLATNLRRIRPKSSRDSAGEPPPGIIVLDDDPTMRAALENIFQSIGSSIRASWSAIRCATRSSSAAPE